MIIKTDRLKERERNLQKHQPVIANGHLARYIYRERKKDI